MDNVKVSLKRGRMSASEKASIVASVASGMSFGAVAAQLNRSQKAIEKVMGVPQTAPFETEKETVSG